MPVSTLKRRIMMQSLFCGCTQYKSLNFIRMRKQARNIHPSPSTSYSNYIHSCSPSKSTHCAKFRLHVFGLLEISISTAISQISPALHTKLYCISISMQLSRSWIIWFVHASRDPCEAEEKKKNAANMYGELPYVSDGKNSGGVSPIWKVPRIRWVTMVS